MIRIITFFLISLCYWLMACNEPGKKNLLPQLIDSDSAVVMYYHTPGDPRFFKYTKVQDMMMVTSIISEVNKGTIKSRPDCATQGKIYFYGKGDAVYAVYFSDTEDCLTYSIIVTGEKYYLKMSKEVKKILQEFRKIAVVPAVTN